MLPVVTIQLAEFQLGFLRRQGQWVDTRLEVDTEAGIRIDDLLAGVVAGGVGIFFDISLAAQGIFSSSTAILLRAAREAAISSGVRTLSKAR